MTSGPRAPHRLADPAGGRGVVVLDQDAVEQGVPVVEAAPGAHCGLLQRAQAGRGLAGVEQPGPGPGERLDVPAGERRDAAQPLQEVQRRPVAGAHVLLEREREELSDRIVGPAEVDGRPARRPVPRGGTRHSYFLPLRDAGRRLALLFARAPFPAFRFRDPALLALFFALRAALPRPLVPPFAFFAFFAFFGFARRAAARLGARARALS